jgi:hypothetical protein
MYQLERRSFQLGWKKLASILGYLNSTFFGYGAIQIDFVKFNYFDV